MRRDDVTRLGAAAIGGAASAGTRTVTLILAPTVPSRSAKLRNNVVKVTENSYLQDEICGNI